MGAILLESSIIFVRNYEVCYKYIPTFILEMLLHVLHSLVIILLYMEMVKYIIFLIKAVQKCRIIYLLPFITFIFKVLQHTLWHRKYVWQKFVT